MKKWFWGVFFLLAAVAIVISQIGDFQDFGIWTILMTVVLLAIIIQSISQKAFSGIFVPIGILYWVLQEPLVFPYIQFWVLMLTGVFVSMGLSFIFSKNSWSGCGNTCGGVFKGAWRFAPSEEVSGDENNPIIDVKFGGTTNYIRSDALESTKINICFGGAEIYFQDVTLSSNGADIYLECSFSGVELYVPRAWNIQSTAKATLGSIEIDGGLKNYDMAAPTLRLHGGVSFGAVEIKRV